MKTSRAVEWTILGAVLAIVSYLSLAILWPFVNIIVGSSIIAIAFHPIHARMARATGRPSLSALAVSLLVVITILIPLGFLAGLAVRQLMALGHSFSGGSAPAIIEPAARAWDWSMQRIGMDGPDLNTAIARYAKELAGFAAGSVLTVASNVTNIVVSVVFGLFTLFFLFRDGTRIVHGIPHYLPLEPAQTERVIARVRDVIYASLYGGFVIAGVQAVLLGVAFWLLGIPSAALWALATLIAALIPVVGAWAVWVPGSIFLLMTGHTVGAIVLALWGGVIVSSVDNFLRPALVGGRVGLNELVMFFAVLGGLSVFGIFGLVMGPVVFAVAGSLLEVLHGEEHAPDKEDVNR